MKSTVSTWLSRLNPAKSKVAAVATAAGMVATLPGCLERPLGTAAPRTTNVIVDLLQQNVVSKVDMLFVIDNSMSMADKQAILADAVPDLVGRFVKPVCVNADNVEAPYDANGNCPNGYGPEFTPIEDIHIGVITSSLGGFGSKNDCVPNPSRPYYVQKYDMAHLIGSLTDPIRQAAGAGDGGDFLQWKGGGNQELATLTANFAKQVQAAGEQGCGWEATMEAWVHFLVDPQPFKEIVRKPCRASDTTENCAGPAGAFNADGNWVVDPDTVILEQRNQFLRMDSLLAVIMLTDENDCSFKINGQQWLVADSVALGESVGTVKGSEQCAENPDDPCCQSCGRPVVDGCPSITANDGQAAAAGCEERFYPAPTAGNWDDQANLRCFKQKQRFGQDHLMPIERYSNALNLLQICPNSETLDGCSNPVPNPVFTRDGVTRPKTLVFFGGIVGVPWQDLAVDPDADVLQYRKARSDNPEEVIDWDRLLGAKVEGKRLQYPVLDGTLNPLMYESVDPRPGLPGPDSGYMANPSNGHEWNIADRSDLQYACIFPKPPTDCPTDAEVNKMQTDNPADPIANCDCTYYGSGAGDFKTPLCQQADGSYGMRQAFGKAYPGTRQLQALERFAEVNPAKNAIVASICPKEADPNDKEGKRDWGYRPAVATIVDRLKEQLQEPCLPRPLATKEDGGAACVIVEATTDPQGCQIGPQYAREELPESFRPLVLQTMLSKEVCDSSSCPNYKLCQIPQIRPEDEGYNSCVAGARGANGWCYFDQDKLTEDQQNNPAVQSALAKCPDTAKRKLRFAGEGQAKTASSLTFYACSGSVYDVAEEM